MNADLEKFICDRFEKTAKGYGDDYTGHYNYMIGFFDCLYLQQKITAKELFWWSNYATDYKSSMQEWKKSLEARA